MSLNPKAAALTGAAVCGGSALAVGLLNLRSSDYGRDFLEVLASLYPGYSMDRSIDSVLVLAGYALLKGAVLGWVTAWLYNRAEKSS
jgi:hypothetical protein